MGSGDSRPRPVEVTFSPDALRRELKEVLGRQRRTASALMTEVPRYRPASSASRASSGGSRQCSVQRNA